jgi:hypothetical protein
MYLGEMVVKTIVAALVAAIDDDKDRSRYRYASRLARADGIGDWSSALAEVLTGPPSQHLLPGARVEQRELTQKNETDTWQYQAAQLLHDCLKLVDPGCEALPAKVDGLRWVRDFARLRNDRNGAPKTDIRKLPQLENR